VQPSLSNLERLVQDGTAFAESFSQAAGAILRLIGGL